MTQDGYKFNVPLDHEFDEKCMFEKECVIRNLNESKNRSQRLSLPITTNKKFSKTSQPRVVVLMNDLLAVQGMKVKENWPLKLVVPPLLQIYLCNDVSFIKFLVYVIVTGVK